MFYIEYSEKRKQINNFTVKMKKTNIYLTVYLFVKEKMF